MVQSLKPEKYVTTEIMEGRSYAEFKITDHMYVFNTTEIIIV